MPAVPKTSNAQDQRCSRHYQHLGEHLCPTSSLELASVVFQACKRKKKKKEEGKKKGKELQCIARRFPKQLCAAAWLLPIHARSGELRCRPLGTSRPPQRWRLPLLLQLGCPKALGRARAAALLAAGELLQHQHCVAWDPGGLLEPSTNSGRAPGKAEMLPGSISAAELVAGSWTFETFFP